MKIQLFSFWFVFLKWSVEWLLQVKQFEEEQRRRMQEEEGKENFAVCFFWNQIFSITDSQADSLCSCCTSLWMNDCSFTQCIGIPIKVVYMVVRWPMPYKTSAISARFVRAPYNHAQAYSAVWSHIHQYYYHFYYYCACVLCIALVYPYRLTGRKTPPHLLTCVLCAEHCWVKRWEEEHAEEEERWLETQQVSVCCLHRWAQLGLFSFWYAFYAWCLRAFQR